MQLFVFKYIFNCQDAASAQVALSHRIPQQSEIQVQQSQLSMSSLLCVLSWHISQHLNGHVFRVYVGPQQIITLTIVAEVTVQNSRKHQ